jgi:hypothetical protein
VLKKLARNLKHFLSNPAYDGIFKKLPGLSPAKSDLIKPDQTTFPNHFKNSAPPHAPRFKILNTPFLYSRARRPTIDVFFSPPAAMFNQ